MAKKSRLRRFLYWARDLWCRQLYAELMHYCRGHVLDVGGWDFYLTAKQRRVPHDTWTVLEYSQTHLLKIEAEQFRCVCGDGCKMPFGDRQFDAVLSIQVLEHVFEPLRMVQEMVRVLKPRGHAIFLVPQTGTLHSVPHHYYNFTRYWIKRALAEAGLELVKLKPIGGRWSSMASRLIYFFLQSFRAEGLSTSECRRNVWFYLLLPLMMIYAAVSIPVLLIFSLGDLSEEPNNHLVVARKP